MSRTFDPFRILTSLSRDLLRELFIRHHASPPPQWAVISQRNTAPLMAAWESMTDADRGRMQVVLHEVFVLSHEEGLAALTDELRCRDPQKLQEIGGLDLRYDKALWAWLNAPDAFDEAAIFARADLLSKGRYWNRWAVPAFDNLQIGDQQIEALQQKLRHIYWPRQMRGRHCSIQHHRRNNGVDYFFAHLDNWPDQLLAFKDDGKLEPLSGRYAFANVFAYDKSTGMLDLVARCGREMYRELSGAFCRAILGIEPIDIMPQKPAYRLDHLLTSGFVLPTVPEDRVASVRLTRIRLAARAATKKVRYEEFGFSTYADLAAAEAELRDRLVDRSMNPRDLKVTSVGFSLKVRHSGRSRLRSLTFDVNAPNTCNLKDKADDLRAVGERCLKLWGISRV